MGSIGYPPETHPENWVPVVEQPVFQPRKLRVVCIGAGEDQKGFLTTGELTNLGYSGLMIAHKYKYETPMTDYVDLTIYEKNRKINSHIIREVEFDQSS